MQFTTESLSFGALSLASSDWSVSLRILLTIWSSELQKLRLVHFKKDMEDANYKVDRLELLAKESFEKVDRSELSASQAQTGHFIMDSIKKANRLKL